MRTLLIFAGAGASRGVSGEKYPIAIDFRKRLPKSITDLPLYRRLTEYLSNSVGSESIDIEHILWELGRLYDSLGELTESDRFAFQLLTTNQISKIVSSNHSGQAVHSQFDQLRSIIKTLQNQINERVYEFYSRPPDKDELNESWIPLFREMVNLSFEQIDIFTTNYDLVIESALASMPEVKVGMGFSEGVFPGINLATWRGGNSLGGGLLTKLHGSVDWKLGNGGADIDPVIRRGHPEFDGDHAKRLILYPGFKGQPSREPFISFHEYFRRRLKVATHLLFIGFAFRDNFINELVNEGLSASCKVAVVDPSEKLPRVSFLKNALHLRQGFGIGQERSLLARGGITPFLLDDLQQWFR